MTVKELREIIASIPNSDMTQIFFKCNNNIVTVEEIQIQETHLVDRAIPPAPLREITIILDMK